MRLIDADALYKDICFSIDQMTDAGIAVDAEYLWGKLKDALDNAPTIEPKRGEWTPCSERLPEENEEVLVCDEDGTMEVCDLEMFGRGIGLKWTDKSGYECWLDVVAWMPLPEPYREREGE